VRSLVITAVSISLLTLVPSAFAQSAQRSPSSEDLTQDGFEHQHPDWFNEPNTYKPCPANVGLPNGRTVCLDADE
jgi:hypothetical protein